jgi:hypothetical protein
LHSKLLKRDLIKINSEKKHFIKNESPKDKQKIEINLKILLKSVTIGNKKRTEEIKPLESKLSILSI